MSLYSVGNNKSTEKTNKLKYITVYDIYNNPKVFKLKDFSKLDNNEVDINVKLSDDIVPIHEDENKQYVKFDFNKLNGEKVFDMTFTVLIGMDFYSILDEIIIEMVK